MTTEYLLHHPIRWMRLLATKPEMYWLGRGKAMVDRLYKNMRLRVPAYRHFSRTHKGKRSLIISKDSYLRRYPLADLCWDGNLRGNQMTISATSGSSGEPFYFPRTAYQDLQYAAVAEMYLRNNFSIHNKSTLYIIGWGMGVWIGGVFSYSAIRILAERGKYPISVITPGTSIEEILKAVKKLGPAYDQIIIGGYPPMIKDLVDEGNRQRIGWGKHKVKFIFSAEGFSERFREYVIKHARLTDTYRDTLNHYGTVDMGTMAHETPVCILIRRMLESRQDIHRALFGVDTRQPTLAQYIPELFYFEAEEGRIICSGNSGLPLFRYDLIDSGGIHTLASVRNIFRSFGEDLDRAMQQAGIYETLWNIPFVYVFERRDFTVKFSGANIYPQEIRQVLEDPIFESFITGKCTMEVLYNENMNQHLMVHVELKEGVCGNDSLCKKICERMVDSLREHNSEYAYLYRSLTPERMTPQIKLWQHKSPPHFLDIGKHRWVRKGAQ